MIADDHEVIRRGLRQIVERYPGWEICGEATTGIEALERARTLHPDILILDLTMPGMDGVELVSQIRAGLPGMELLVFTIHESEELIRALVEAGAHGYLLKSDPTSEIVTAIEALERHDPYFTAKIAKPVRETLIRIIKGDRSRLSSAFPSARERQIIERLAQGKSNKEVAADLGISVKTVETHRTTIMHKVGATSIVELVHYAVRNKIFPP